MLIQKNSSLISLSRKFAFIVPFCGAGLLMTSCASRTPEGYVALPATADPSSEIESTEEQMLEARQANLHILAPKSFSNAQQSLEKARDSRSDNDSNEDVLKQVGYARAWLAEARTKAELSRVAMAPLMAAREGAVYAEAARILSKDFASLDEDARELSSKIESDGNMKPAQKDGAELAKKYHALELEALEQGKLGSAREQIKQAKDEGAKKHAPKTLEAAEARLEAARQSLHAHGARNQDGFQASVNAANESAKQVLQVTRQAKVVGKTPNEEIVLREQRDRETAASLAQINAETSRMLSQASRSRQQLQGDLQDAQARTEKLAAIRERFSSAEAEVADRGDAVVIRLKGLQFPSNQAAIPTSAFPLLSKVQEALAEFPEADLKIEGHTDSVGSRDINMKLSQARANAVSTYLISNNAADSERIEAIGKGLEDPIASNRSSQGRAQNRRIDVILDMKPASSPRGASAPKSGSM